MEFIGYHSNLNPFSVLGDGSQTTKAAVRREFDNSELLNVCEWNRLSGLLDWHLRRGWDVHIHLKFGGRFPVGKAAVRDLFVLV
jgi:hypothetical protein